MVNRFLRVHMAFGSIQEVAARAASSKWALVMANYTEGLLPVSVSLFPYLALFLGQLLVAHGAGIPPVQTAAHCSGLVGQTHFWYPRGC